MLAAAQNLSFRYKTYLARAVVFVALYALGYVIICRTYWSSNDIPTSLTICCTVLFAFVVLVSIEVQAQIEPFRRSSRNQAVDDDTAVFTPLFINYPTRLQTVNLILIIIHVIVLGAVLPYANAFLAAFLTGGIAKP
jgi:hypothetical protein